MVWYGHLTTITLHYYSDSDRSLPRLRFFALPGDFDIWNAFTGSYNYAEVTEVTPGKEPASVNININVTFNTNKNSNVQVQQWFLAGSE